MVTTLGRRRRASNQISWVTLGKHTWVTFRECRSHPNHQRGVGKYARCNGTRGVAWIVEGKLNYMDDPKLKDKDSGLFKMYAVPLPKQ